MGASQLEGVGDTSKLPAPQLEKGVRWAVCASVSSSTLWGCWFGM